MLIISKNFYLFIYLLLIFLPYSLFCWIVKSQNLTLNLISGRKNFWGSRRKCFLGIPLGIPFLWIILVGNCLRILLLFQKVKLFQQVKLFRLVKLWVLGFRLCVLVWTRQQIWVGYFTIVIGVKDGVRFLRLIQWGCLRSVIVIRLIHPGIVLTSIDARALREVNLEGAVAHTGHRLRPLLFIKKWSALIWWNYRWV